ncbi:MAG: c-type cytochrome biogenesis protein CcmI [Bauldia sp.]
MLLWIAMAVLAAAASIPLLVALGRPPRGASQSAQAVAIYRDQLDEVSRDVARGVVGEADAEGARTEIARRLIRAGDAPAEGTATSDRWRSVATAVIIAMPVAALALYLLLGSPLDPDLPLAARPDVAEFQKLNLGVAQIEAHLAAAPDDGKGWEVIAPVYSALGRDADAAHAWQRAIDLLGSTAVRQANLGETLVAVGGGAVTPDAKAAFEKAHALAQDDARPRFYLALALSQAGDKDAATAAWRDLIATAPKDASWLPLAANQLAALQGGPEGMVAALAARLKTEPGDADGWAELVRSYMVLGRAVDARAALADARVALAGDAAKIAAVEAAARDAGLAEATQ